MTRREGQIVSRARLEALMVKVSVASGYPPEEIRGPCRRRDLVKARREFAFWARQAGASLPEIGRCLNRHHTTVMHLLR